LDRHPSAALDVSSANLQKAKEPEGEGPRNDEGGKKSRGRPKGSRSKAREEEIQPAETAAEGVRKMLDAKKLSSKINYANLDSLFDGDEPPPAKKTRSFLLGPSLTPQDRGRS
jgi:hypothetical protein